MGGCREMALGAKQWQARAASILYDCGQNSLRGWMFLQMGELSFDFAEGLVVGLGIEGDEKRILGAKWQEFVKNAITFTVCH